jgi:flagellar biosynthesis protein FlhB
MPDDNKTEQPTPKRLEEARKKGQVAKSVDLTQAVLFLSAGTVFSVTGTTLFYSLKGLVIESLDPALLAGPLNPNALVARIGSAAVKFMLLSAPLLVVLTFTAAAVDALQIGGLNFATEALSPNLDKLNPVQGLQNIFLKPKTYLELVKSLLKVGVILWIAYTTVIGSLRDAILSSRLGLLEIGAMVPTLVYGLLFRVGGAFLVLGAADFFLQKRLYMKNLMMSIDEVKREYKEQEGDPHIKSHRKALHQAMLNENMAKAVPKATAVVVNPTHLAVALNYEEASMNAPQIVAKGELLVAQKIIAIAKTHNVPVVRNVPLAHRLYALELGQEIPEELYEAAAEILNMVSKLTQANED